jgi:hypothetical protein
LSYINIQTRRDLEGGIAEFQINEAQVLHFEEVSFLEDQVTCVCEFPKHLNLTGSRGILA